METERAVEIVQAWQAAANRQEIDRLIKLSDPNIEIVGPRGSGYGHQLLRDWLGRAGLTLETLRVFVGDNRVVLAQHGVWRSLETGEITGERDIASYFQVTNGQVSRFARFDDLNTGLAEARLNNTNEILPS